MLAGNSHTIVYLDFNGITNITASYIAATIVQLLRLVASGSLERYLIIGGIHEDYHHEIEYVLNHEHTPTLLRTTTGALRVLGPLDTAYAQTLDAVTQRGRTTAKELQQVTTERIGQTGWIKRLATLHAQGLVRRTRIGREYHYEPITLEEQ
jgi:hypothetical protein